ncbi:MAG: A/G-specific adenine glycosylase [Dinoroseobacter sp.]|jgi:A/G-specific adenine glycosylase
MLNEGSRMRDDTVNEALSATLLAWYDVHARALPWRVPPGSGLRADPYRIWMSEIMLQQTTVAAVKDYFAKFTGRWPTVSALAAAEDADVMAAWAGLGYYARARNLLKCARVVVADHGGIFPSDRAILQTLPGIGPYTSAAIASIAFGASETVVDGNVERVMARLRGIETPLPPAKPELVAAAEALTPVKRAGDYAQAVMDLGATLCSPKSPTCGICPWRDPCVARAAGNAAELPRKLPKPEKPTRRGTAYIARRSDGAFLLETRPAKGLLGGMLGWPGTVWSVEMPEDAPPLEGSWHDAGIEVRHTFTHFHLKLRVLIADVPQDAAPQGGQFIAKHNFRPGDLPTVMKKAFSVATPWPATD